MIRTLLCSLLVLVLIVWILIHLYRQLKAFKEILKFPAPPTTNAILGHLPQMLKDAEGLFKVFRGWAKNQPSGYVFYICPLYFVNFIKAEDVEILISSSKHSAKSRMYELIHRWLGDGLLTSAGEKWQKRRKLLTSAFHFNILRQFVKVFHRETKRLVENLDALPDRSDVDVVPMMAHYALYTINETSMGTRLDLNDKADQLYEQAMLGISKIFVYRITRPWLSLHFVHYYLTFMGRLEIKLIETLHNFTNNVIKNRSNEFKLAEGKNVKKKRMAMLDLLLTAKKEGEIDLKGIQDEINTFMFEGHDTTAMSLSFTLMLFAVHQDVQNRIVEEIHEVFPDPEEEPTIPKLNDLKYLERCIKESLRLYPSVSFMSRVSDEDIVTSTNSFVPSGSIVNVHIYDLHRDPEVFPDPDKFDPDRFLLENLVNRHPYAYIPFSAGPRNCIGQKFAMLEMKTVLCGILRKFILKPVSTPETLRLCAEMILRSENGVHVGFIRRKK